MDRPQLIDLRFPPILLALLRQSLCLGRRHSAPPCGSHTSLEGGFRFMAPGKLWKRATSGGNRTLANRVSTNEYLSARMRCLYRGLNPYFLVAFFAFAAAF